MKKMGLLQLNVPHPSLLFSSGHLIKKYNPTPAVASKIIIGQFTLLPVLGAGEPTGLAISEGKGAFANSG
jgi:hypothetical protein